MTGSERTAKARASITPEQRIANGKKGAEIRKQNQTFREIFNKLLDAPISDKKKAKELAALGLNANAKSVIADTLIKKCKMGQLDAIKYLTSMIGEQETIPEANVNIGEIFITQKKQADYIKDEED